MQQSTSNPDNSGNAGVICIGVSSCLLGHQVRYDGKHKYHTAVSDRLCTTFRCLPICPEYAIGLGIPREPIHLVQSQTGIRTQGVYDKHHDVTRQLQAYAVFVAQQLTAICGYVFKSRSPSCALDSAPLMTPEGQSADTVSGIYAQKLVTLLPGLPVIDETALRDNESIDKFIESVRHFAASNK